MAPRPPAEVAEFYGIFSPGRLCGPGFYLEEEQ
jgi:hypothetical protein